MSDECDQVLLWRLIRVSFCFLLTSSSSTPFLFVASAWLNDSSPTHYLLLMDGLIFHLILYSLQYRDICVSRVFSHIGKWNLKKKTKKNLIFELKFPQLLVRLAIKKLQKWKKKSSTPERGERASKFCSSHRLGSWHQPRFDPVTDRSTETLGACSLSPER